MENRSCGRATLEFRNKVKEKLDDWFGGSDKYKIMYQWFDQDTSNNVILKECSGNIKNLYFLRIFSIGDRIEISQDGKEEI